MYKNMNMSLPLALVVDSEDYSVVRTNTLKVP